MIVITTRYEWKLMKRLNLVESSLVTHYTTNICRSEKLTEKDVRSRTYKNGKYVQYAPVSVVNVARLLLFGNSDYSDLNYYDNEVRIRLFPYAGANIMNCSKYIEIIYEINNIEMFYNEVANIKAKDALSNGLYKKGLPNI